MERNVLLTIAYDGSTFHGEVGAGLINLTGENLVLTIRNIEKRAPVKAIVRPNNS